MEWSERIGRRIRLRDLHILLAVVECKSLAKAAERLAVSRPVVSKVIADLEHTLGVRLVERDRHGAEPTIYGRALLKRGTTVFDELREGLKDIEFLVDPAAGEVRIGSSAFLAASFVSEVIDRLSRRYPRIVFHLVVTQPDMLLSELSERNVDLVVAQRWGLSTDAIEKFNFEALFDDSNVVVTSAQNPWARRRKIALADLVNESWLLPPPERAFGPVYMEAFRAQGLDYPRATVYTISAEVRMRLLATGRFLTIVPASVLKFFTERTKLKVLPVEVRLPPLPIGIVTRKNQTLSPVIERFIECAREVTKNSAKRK
jgi:DNA-binding transcriptional LysR family regulator